MGIGSPVEGDGLGMQAVTLLQQQLAWCAPSLRLSWLVRERPGLSLLNDWGQADCVVLLDAMAPAGRLPRVQRLEPRQLIAAASPLSTHSVGVAEALALAQTLDALPAKLVVLGIDAGGAEEKAQWLAPLMALLSESLGGGLRFAPLHTTSL